MSEPVIKPVLWKCPQCDSTRSSDMGPIGICVHPTYGDADFVSVDVPLYTRDDLVRAVAAALREYEVMPNPHRAAVFLVDRLTKEET